MTLFHPEGGEAGYSVWLEIRWRDVSTYPYALALTDARASYTYSYIYVCTFILRHTHIKVEK